jgi:hypothetical protein
MCNIQQVLQPDANLTKMLGFIKIILIINLLSSFLRIFLNPSDMIYDLFCTLFLFLAYNSVYFLYMAVYIIFSLVNSVLLFIKSATIFQMLIQNTLGDAKSRVPLVLGISLYLLIFYIFAIIFTYPVYKEMKAQLMENFGGEATGARSYQRQNDDEERPGAVVRNLPATTTTTSNNAGFQAFSGRGVAVGGGS